MSTYCIGDLHGCYDEFIKLLDLIKFDEKKDQLLLTGDLLGRGPKPIETLNTILELKNCVHAVLGNHDLNFLAICDGASKSKPRDNLEVVLKAPNLGEILDFYYACPLLYLDDDSHLALCHAGVYPAWDLGQAMKISKEVSKVLKDPLRRSILLHNMYKDNPVCYQEQDQGLKRWRFTFNAFTRMRLCDKHLNLDYGHSSTTVDNAAKENLFPWFDFCNEPRYKKKVYTLVFGHWAALNAKCSRQNMIALDTGCVWGGSLTCWCADNNKTCRVKSLGHLKPKA